MSEIEKKILATKKMTPEQLETAIKTAMDAGARNRFSALNKIYRQVAVESLGETEIAGFFLQDYARKRGGLSVYLQTEKGETIRVSVMPGTPTPSQPFQIGNAIKMTAVVRKRNVFTGISWVETTPKTRAIPTKLDKSFWNCVSNALPDDGGIVMIAAKVKGVWPVNKYEGNVRGEELPIIDRGGVANVRLSIYPIVDNGPEGMTCKMHDVQRLKLLVGDDISWLEDEGALLELADMLKNQSVRVFGSTKNVIGRGAAKKELDKPYFDIRNFGWVIMSPDDDTAGVDTGGASKAGWGAGGAPAKPSEDEEPVEPGSEDEADINLGEDETK